MGRLIGIVDSDRFRDVVYLFFVLFLAGFVLSLPLFPSNDGAVHLYFSHIFGNLLMHKGPFGQYFALRRVLGPYTLQIFLPGIP